MKKCSKEHDEILQMKKETKTALKVRGIMGTAESVSVCGKAGDWGAGETRDAGFHGASVLQRTKAGMGWGTSDL